MVSQLDRVKVLAQGIGLDVDLLLNEIVGQVKDSVAVPDIDTNSIKAKVVEEVGKIETTLRGQIEQIRDELVASVDEIRKNIDKMKEGLPQLVQAHTESVLLANLVSIKQELNSRIDSQQKEFVQMMQNATGGGSSFERYLPLLQGLIGGGGGGGGMESFKNQLASLGDIVESIDKIRGRSNNNIDPATIDRAVLKGVEIGYRAKNYPLPVSPSEGHLPKPENQTKVPNKGDLSQKPKRKTNQEIVKEVLGG